MRRDTAWQKDRRCRFTTTGRGSYETSRYRIHLLQLHRRSFCINVTRSKPQLGSSAIFIGRCNRRIRTATLEMLVLVRAAAREPDNIQVPYHQSKLLETNNTYAQSRIMLFKKPADPVWTCPTAWTLLRLWKICMTCCGCRAFVQPWPLARLTAG